MVTDSELDDLDLGSVIDAVKRASDNELAKLTEISNKLEGLPARSSASTIKAELDSKKIETAVKSGVENATVVTKKKRKASRRNSPVAQRSSRSNEVNLDLGINAPEVVTQAQPIASPINRIADNPISDPPLSMLEKRAGEVLVSVDQQSSTRDDADSLENVPKKIEQAVRDGLSGFDGYWKDAAGKLRRKDGKYASSQESQAFNAAEVAQLRQQELAGKNTEKQTGLFAQFASTLKEFAKERVTSSLESDNDAADAAGAAAGGTFFYSAKEMYNISQETKEAFEEAKQSMTDAKGKLSGTRDAIAASKLGKLLGVKPSESEAPETVSDELAESVHTPHEAPSLQDAIKATPESEQQTKAALSETSTAVRVESNTQERNINTDSNQASQVTSFSQIDKTKDAQYKAEHLEVLKEQTTERKDMINDVLDKLDEVKSAFGSANGSGGLMDLAGDLFDRKGRNGRRGRAGKGGKAGRIKSIFSKAGGATKGVASKGMSMAGGAFKGLSKLGGIAGKAVPFLAPALMAYDAFSGFTDKDKQKETFNLKDGQEATTGQKSSMALANVLDLGGLVSGGAGLLGGVLGSLGFDGAQEALTFDSGDMARGIYGMFGGDTPEKESGKPVAKADPEKEREYSANAVEYKQADQFERESMEREADPQRLTTERVKERSQETGKSFGYTYKRMSREREQQKQERQRVADEMGIDISGNVEHPDFGSMYSPKKKGDQLKIVDQELSRRQEVEALAKNGEFSNGRFIGAEPQGYMSSLNTKVTAAQQKLSSQQEPAPTVAKAEANIRGNERVSEIKAQQQDKAFRGGVTPQSVKLDDETIKKITQNKAVSTSTKVIERNANRQNKEAVSPARTTGSIPNNFNDRSLQRQSADLE